MQAERFFNKVIGEVNQRGFTLVELMIVIGIIGIMVAISVPQFVSYKTRSSNAIAKAAAHNLKADQANLNAELGGYGHTEGDPYDLQAVTSFFPLPLDSSIDPNLRISATATQEGARLSGTNPRNFRDYAVGIAMGDNMVISARDNESDPSAFYVIARHVKGDTAYGVDSDVHNQLYAVSNPSWRGQSTLMAIEPGSCEWAFDEFVDQPGGGAPTAKWVVTD